MNEKELEYLNSLKIMDDNFGRIVFQDQNCGIELLRRLNLITNDQIIHYETQMDLKTITFRSVILDYYVATDKSIINVEIENNPLRATPKRARFHASHLDVHASIPNISFNKLKNKIVVFLCSFDYFKKGLSHYIFENIEKNTNFKLNDQSKIIYVNGTYQGNDTIGQLIHDLNCSDPNQIINPIFKKRLILLKQTERGQAYMCKVWDEIRNEGFEKGKLSERINSIQAIIKSLDVSVDKALEILQIPKKDWDYYKQLML